MTVSYGKLTYECVQAVRNQEKAVLYLSDGSTVELIGISDWAAISLEGGDWSSPEVTPEEQLRADVDFIAVMMGVEL